MKFKKVNGKFYVNGEEFPTFAEAWAEIKKGFRKRGHKYHYQRKREGRMKDIEKIFVIFKSIVTLLMFVVLSFIEPIFIYIAGASVIIGGMIVVTFAFISAPLHNDKESEDTE